MEVPFQNAFRFVLQLLFFLQFKTGPKKRKSDLKNGPPDFCVLHNGGLESAYSDDSFQIHRFTDTGKLIQKSSCAALDLENRW